MPYLSLDMAVPVEAIHIVLMSSAEEVVAVEKYDRIMAAAQGPWWSNERYYMALTHPSLHGPIMYNLEDPLERQNPLTQRSLTLEVLERAGMTFVYKAANDPLLLSCIEFDGVLPTSLEPGILVDLFTQWYERLNNWTGIPLVRDAAPRAPPPTPSTTSSSGGDDGGEGPIYKVLAYLSALTCAAPQVQDVESESEFDFHGEWTGDTSSGERSAELEG